jgi:hypothetical protein
MATAVGLNFQLTASAVGMSDGISDASKQLGRLGSAAQKAASDISVLKTLEIGRTFVDGIQSLFSTFSGFTQGSFAAVESASNLSRELGISYTQLQELQIAAKLAGVSTDDLGRAFTKAQVAITKASQGGAEAVKALSSIGLSAADFEGLSSSEQFTLIANAINGISDPAQRAAAAVSIFGRSGAELLPVFRELGGNLLAAQNLLAKFNGGLSTIDVGRINSLGDTFQLAGQAVAIVANKVLAALAPALEQAVNQFINFAASLDIATIANTAASVIEAIGGALEFAYNTAALLSPVFSAIGSAISFIADNARGAAVGLGLATGALVLYQASIVAATIATTGLGVAIKTLLASTGIGLLVTLFGTLAGAAIEWGLSTKDSGDKAKAGVQGVADAAASTTRTAETLGRNAAASSAAAFKATEDAAKKAADEAKKASDAARREADASIERMNVEMNFGGDSQRANAAKAVDAIQQDILRTEQEIAAAREAGDQAAIDAGTSRLAQLDQAMAREKDIASGARKAAEERAKYEAQYAEQRLKFEEQIANAFRAPTPQLNLEDTRTASGYAALQRFSESQANDPALEEYRKQLKELQAIRREIAKTSDQTETVDILGG